jgi:hypothetical protein
MKTYDPTDPMQNPHETLIVSKIAEFHPQTKQRMVPHPKQDHFL